jgi:hypothetical protein
MATGLQRRKITSRTTDMTPGMKNTGKARLKPVQAGNSWRSDFSKIRQEGQAF